MTNYIVPVFMNKAMQQLLSVLLTKAAREKVLYEELGDKEHWPVWWGGGNQRVGEHPLARKKILSLKASVL